MYSYAPLFQSDNIPSGLPYDDGSVDPEAPRCETVFIGEVPVRKILRSVVRDSMGYRRIEEVQVLDPCETNHLAAWTAQEESGRIRPCLRFATS